MCDARQPPAPGRPWWWQRHGIRAEYLLDRDWHNWLFPEKDHCKRNPPDQDPLLGNLYTVYRIPKTTCATIAPLRELLVMPEDGCAAAYGEGPETQSVTSLCRLCRRGLSRMPPEALCDVGRAMRASSRAAQRALRRPGPQTRKDSEVRQSLLAMQLVKSAGKASRV